MISPLAFISPEAKLGDNVTVYPFAYIDKNVEIGDNCTIMPYASIMSGTKMGSGNRVFQGAILGAEPQDFKFKGDETTLTIGDNNIFREKVIVNRATLPDGATSIGNGNYLLEGVHVSHDTRIGNEGIFGNGTKIAGDCIIEDKVILSSGVILQQGCRVGTLAMIESGCRSKRDVPPFIVAAHNPITYYGINAVILRRAGYSDRQIDDIAKVYRQIYQCNTSLENALLRIREEMAITAEIRTIIDFIESSAKGLIALNRE